MKNNKTKNIISSICFPNVRTLFYSVLVFWSLTSVYALLFFTLKDENLHIFSTVWLIVPVSFVLYILYGYTRLLVLRMKKEKGAKILSLVKTDKTFRTIFTASCGVIVSFSFALMYSAKGFIKNSGFYWFLSEFYLVSAILTLYLNTIAETEYSKNDYVAYIIIYCVSVFLAVAMAGVTFYVVVFDGIFEKSVYLIAFIGAFTIYKICSAVYSFDKARKKKSRLNLSKSLVALSSALFSVFTLCVALMIIITQNPLMKHFSYLGFGFAVAIFVMAVVGLAYSCKDYVKSKKEHSATLGGNI